MNSELESINPIELKLGLMTNKELAEWFGISPKTLRNTREKRLKELEEYAVFNLFGNKINIAEIKIPIYVKKKSQNYLAIKSHIDENWNENGLATKKEVSERIYNKREEYNLNIKPSTTYAYTCKGSNELYGSAREPDKGGEIGNCRYVLCVRDAQTGDLRWFTEEEYQKKLELKEKYLKKFNKEEYQDVEESIYFSERKEKISKETAAKTVYELRHEAYELYFNELEAVVDGILSYATYRKLYDKN